MNKEIDNNNPQTGNTQTWATHTLCEKPGHQTEQSSPYAVFTELKETTEGRVGNGLLKTAHECRVVLEREQSERSGTGSHAEN